MSIEELAIAIQAGDKSLMGELWAGVENLVKWKAKKIMTALESPSDSRRVEFEDLVQSGYFALVAALETYKPERGAFTSWLMYYLQTAFAVTAGYRTSKMENDPMRYALSIDCPVSEDSENTFGDLVPDPNAGVPMDIVENNEWNRQLHIALDAALDAIPPQYANVVRMRFYEGKALEEISQEIKVSGERVRQLANQGIKMLRKPEHACHLYPFYEFDFYCGTGLQAFKNRGMSIQELYLIIMEEREKKLLRHTMRKRNRFGRHRVTTAEINR